MLLLFLLLVPGLKPVRIRWYKSNDTPTRCRTFRSDLHLYDTTCKHTCPEAIAITFVLGIFFTVKRGQQKWKTSSSIIASKRVKTMLRVLPPVKSVSRNNSYCCRFQIVVRSFKLLSTFCNNLSQPTTRHGARACKQKEIQGARSTALRALLYAHCLCYL